MVVTERQLYSSVFHVTTKGEYKVKSVAGSIHATCALDHQSHSSPVIKGVWFQRWDKNKWKYGTVPFIKGDAWKAVVRWYRPVEPLQRSPGPSWCVYHLFPLRYTRKEDRICYDMKLFEIRSPKEGFNILTGVFRPCYVRVVAHISATNRFIRSWPGYNRSWHFSRLEILLGSTPAPPTNVALLFPWNERATRTRSHVRTLCVNRREFRENGRIVGFVGNKGIAYFA